MKTVERKVLSPDVLAGATIVSAMYHEHDDWTTCLVMKLQGGKVIHVEGIGHDWGSVEITEGAG